MREHKHPCGCACGSDVHPYAVPENLPPFLGSLPRLQQGRGVFPAHAPRHPAGLFATAELLAHRTAERLPARRLETLR